MAHATLSMGAKMNTQKAEFRNVCDNDLMFNLDELDDKSDEYGLTVAERSLLCRLYEEGRARGLIPQFEFIAQK